MDGGTWKVTNATTGGAPAELAAPFGAGLRGWPIALAAGAILAIAALGLLTIVHAARRRPERGRAGPKAGSSVAARSMARARRLETSSRRRGGWGWMSWRCHPSHRGNRARYTRDREKIPKISESVVRATMGGRAARLVGLLRALGAVVAASVIVVLAVVARALVAVVRVVARLRGAIGRSRPRSSCRRRRSSLWTGRQGGGRRRDAGRPAVDPAGDLRTVRGCAVRSRAAGWGRWTARGDRRVRPRSATPRRTRSRPPAAPRPRQAPRSARGSASAMARPGRAGAPAARRARPIRPRCRGRASRTQPVVAARAPAQPRDPVRAS